MSRARTITDGMFLDAARALAGCVSDELLQMGSVYPAIRDVRVASRAVAVAVARRAVIDGVAEDLPDLEQRIETKMWVPEYLPYRPA